MTKNKMKKADWEKTVTGSLIFSFEKGEITKKELAKGISNLLKRERQGIVEEIENKINKPLKLRVKSYRRLRMEYRNKKPRDENREKYFEGAGDEAYAIFLIVHQAIDNYLKEKGEK